MPTQLAHIADRRAQRRGPVADRPILSIDDRARLFDHLLVTADAHRKDPDVLLRRQAIYLLGFDTRRTSAEWLAAEQLRAIRDARMTGHVPSWVAIRSSAIALARSGNRDPLQMFVSTALTNNTQDIANLNYWAYWIGEIPEAQADDSFMVTMRPDEWAGARLFRHLVNRLRPGSLHAELNIHTLWTLLAARPALLTLDLNVRAAAKAKIEHLIEDPGLTAQARHKLASVAYAIRLAER